MASLAWTAVEVYLAALRQPNRSRSAKLVCLLFFIAIESLKTHKGMDFRCKFVNAVLRLVSVMLNVLPSRVWDKIDANYQL